MRALTIVTHAFAGSSSPAGTCSIMQASVCDRQCMHVRTFLGHRHAHMGQVRLQVTVIDAAWLPELAPTFFAQSTHGG